jgi:hypothetical protein
MTYSFLTPSREDVQSLPDSEQQSIVNSEGSFLIPFTTDNEPKLVRIFLSLLPHIIRIDKIALDHLDWPQRPRKPSELEPRPEMVRDSSRLLLHLHFPRLVYNGCARTA